MIDKRIWGAALAMSAAMFAGSATAQKFTMKIGNATRADVQYEWQVQMQKRIQADSKGRIKVEIYPSSQLGSNQRMIEGVQLGTIESCVEPGEFFANVAAGLQVPGAPGIFKDGAHAARAIADPKFREAYLKVGESKGIKGISVFIYGPTSIVSLSPIRKYEDFAGKKVRVFGSPIQVDPFRALGGAPLPMPLSEVLPSLQRHVIDGVLSAMTVFTSFRYYDVVKNLTDTQYSMVVSIGVVSKRWFDTLPHDLQQVVLKTGKTLEPEMNKWAADHAARAAKLWVEKGGKLIRLPPEDQAKMMKAVEAAGAKVIEAQPEALPIYNLLKDAARRTM